MVANNCQHESHARLQYRIGSEKIFVKHSGNSDIITDPHISSIHDGPGPHCLFASFSSILQMFRRNSLPKGRIAK